MKSYRTLFATLFAAFLFSSCQKEITDLSPTTPPVGNSARVKTYTEDYTTSGGHQAITFNLTYDASGRLISMISASSPGDKFIYQYAGNTITMDLYNSNVLSIHENFFLNSFSFTDSTLQYNDTKDTMTEKYFYNSNKQLIKLKQYDYSASSGAVLFETKDYTYDGTGNLISMSTGSELTTYEYSTLLNTLSVGPGLLPQAKYLVSKTTYTSGGSTTVLTHTYTFDSSNRLSTEKIVTSDGDILVKTYTY